MIHKTDAKMIPDKIEAKRKNKNPSRVNNDSKRRTDKIEGAINCPV